MHVSVVMCWMLWKGRNEWVWNKRKQDFNLVHSSAVSLLQEWRQAQVQPISFQCNPIAVGGRRWESPGEGHLKCNVDGALPSQGSKVGFGFIIRNQPGEMVVAKNGKMDAPTETLVVEALSCREALSWIKGNGLQNITVESDSLVACFIDR